MCARELEHLNAGTHGGLDVPSPAEAEMMGHLTCALGTKLGLPGRTLRC